MIIGRDAELGEAEAFVAGLATGPSALVIEGEPGIGKSALWNHLLEAAAARSYRVLTCRPIESEAQLAYAALGALLADVPDATLDVLPGR